MNEPLQSSTGLTLEKLLAMKKILDANEFKSTMMMDPWSGQLHTLHGFRFVCPYRSIRGAAKALRISRKQARLAELSHKIVICRR